MIDSFGNNVNLINGLPIRACTTENEDGSYSIFINASLSYEERKKAYIHELLHIYNHDFEKTDVQEIEYRTHKSTIQPGSDSALCLERKQHEKV